jgi:hypothetical protein
LGFFYKDEINPFKKHLPQYTARMTDKTDNNTNNTNNGDHTINSDNLATLCSEMEADSNNDESLFQCFKNLWTEIFNPNGWATFAYFLLWNPLWSLFCLVWVASTGFISIGLWLLPPLGYFVSIRTVMSWRYVNC